MVTKEQIIEYVSTLVGASTDCPFDDDFDTTVLRHNANRKWFGLLFYVRASRIGLDLDGDVLILNLKCEPNLAVLLREKYDWIIPAYHMNKAHWNTVLLVKTSDLTTLQELIAHSYALTQPKLKS